MLWHILDAYDGMLPGDVHVTFANTGKEHEATLQFVNRCATEWGVNVVWLEFDPASEHNTRITDFENASRRGEPLRSIIESRPTAHLFNPVSRYCSVTAKARRMQKFMHKTCGYERWHSAIGLRADEIGRVERALKRAGRDRTTAFMPLATAGVTKETVKEWWGHQPFDLTLPNVGGVTPMGNCVLCPLKSKAKLVNILRKHPAEAQWWVDQEYRMAERIKDVPWSGTGPENRHRFFKDGTSYHDLLARAEKANIFNEEMDYGYDTGIDCNCTD